MTKPNRNMLIVGGLLVVIVFIFLISNGQLKQQSLVTPPTKFTTSDGKDSWLATVSLDRNENFTVEFKTTPEIKPDGTIVSPQKNFTVQLKPGGNLCDYRLDSRSWPTIFGHNFNLMTYYEMGNPERHTPVYVESSSSDAKSFFGKGVLMDATDSGQSQTLADIDGKGILKVTSLFSVPGQQVCPSPSGLVVLNQEGTPRVISAVAWQNKQNAFITDTTVRCSLACALPFSPTCSQCIRDRINEIKYGQGIPTASNYVATFDSLTFDDPNREIKSQLLGTQALGRSSVGIPVMTLTADADYVNAIYYVKPKLSTPEILSISCQEVLESSTGTVRVAIRNAGDSMDTFRYTIKSNKGTISPASDSVAMDPGQVKTLDYVYSVPSVSSTEQASIDYQLCTSSQFDSKCIQKSCQYNIKDVPQNSPPPGDVLRCGDNKCSAEIGETSLTCSLDCTGSGTAGQCKVNQELKNNECICKAGFKQSYDKNSGDLVCTAPFDLFDFIQENIITIGIVTIVGAGAYYFLKSSKRGRKS